MWNINKVLGGMNDTRRPHMTAKLVININLSWSKEWRSLIGDCGNVLNPSLTEAEQWPKTFQTIGCPLRIMTLHTRQQFSIDTPISIYTCWCYTIVYFIKLIENIYTRIIVSPSMASVFWCTCHVNNMDYMIQRRYFVFMPVKFKV